MISFLRSMFKRVDHFSSFFPHVRVPRLPLVFLIQLFQREPFVRDSFLQVYLQLFFFFNSAFSLLPLSFRSHFFQPRVCQTLLLVLLQSRILLQMYFQPSQRFSDVFLVLFHQIRSVRVPTRVFFSFQNLLRVFRDGFVQRSIPSVGECWNHHHRGRRRRRRRTRRRR